MGSISKPQLKNSKNMMTRAWYTVGRNMLPRCYNDTNCTQQLTLQLRELLQSSNLYQCHMHLAQE